MHACIYACMDTYIHAYIHTYMHACMHTCIHAYMHTCIHAYMHTYIHMHVYVYVYTARKLGFYVTIRQTHRLVCRSSTGLLSSSVASLLPYRLFLNGTAQAIQCRWCKRVATTNRFMPQTFQTLRWATACDREVPTFSSVIRSVAHVGIEQCQRPV